MAVIGILVLREDQRPALALPGHTASAMCTHDSELRRSRPRRAEARETAERPGLLLASRERVGVLVEHPRPYRGLHVAELDRVGIRIARHDALRRETGGNGGRRTHDHRRKSQMSQQILCIQCMSASPETSVGMAA
jgi:hypothetical protein